MIPIADRRHPITGNHPSHDGDTVGVRYGGTTGFVGFFGKTRNGGEKWHRGTDFLCVKGAPIYAMHDGRVIQDGEQSEGKGYGIRTKIEHKDDDRGEVTLTVYAHLSAQTVFQGAEVRRGALVGWAGDSGNADPDGQDATPNHLHVETRIDGKHVDPLLWLQGKA